MDFPHIVTIGGGTGQYTLLSGLRSHPVRLSAVVSMADDGGSTGTLRDELGVLPPGDVRQCLVALSESPQELRDLFSYRFDTGGLRGHSFGNIFLSALEKTTGSFEEAVRVAGEVLGVRGEVIPVTTSDVHLVHVGKRHLRGEHVLNDAVDIDPDSLRLDPPVTANPRALAAIASADCIVIGPGNLFCSIIPNLLVDGIADAVRNSKAAVTLNCNLMTKPGHTDGYRVDDFVNAIERHIGTGRVDFITYNTDIPDEDTLRKYVHAGEYPVGPPSAAFVAMHAGRLVPSRLVAADTYVPARGDTLPRTLIRHDSASLAETILRKCLIRNLHRAV